MTIDTATQPDIQVLGQARQVLADAVARAGNAPYVRIHVGRG
jgi:hypothetical protein